jgi:flagellar biosynthesis anti-sigma factor FlgM
MEIKKIIAYDTQAIQQPQEQNSRVAQNDRNSASDPRVEADSVKLSNRYQEMTQVKKVVMDGGELRMDRVDQIRNMVENKQYEVDPEKIAQRMLEELW